MAINHLIGRPQFSDEKRAAVSGFMYHLSRWASQLFMADEVRGAAAAGFFALETLGQGILILDDRQHVLFANQAVNQLLGDVLTAQGFRRSWGYGATLRDLFKQVTADRQARSTTVVHTVGGRVVSLLFSLLPLPREQGIGFTMPKGLEAASRAEEGSPGQREAMLPAGNASVLVLVRAQVEAQATGSRLYQQAFGLTAAEARLADALAQGHSPQDHADRARVSIATVRTQIRALLSKTGAVNLRALVVLLASLPKASR
ncbi:helix-turn-helix transcriptional regulator [Rhodanobacter geophilus]|uniref:Helix-turn-helix transcriptional regulator n=1 Tax=Rhodanobacter geophilus TaxID=3162488 RepID=A0ABV3QMG7_9GAMM